MKTLKNPSDQELNETFAVDVAGWHTCIGGKFWADANGEIQSDSFDGKLTRFTQSSDAVLPWLQKRVTETNCLWSITVRPNGQFLINEGYQDESGPMMNGDIEDKCLARAAVIALLRAYGVTVVFTA